MTSDEPTSVLQAARADIEKLAPEWHSHTLAAQARTLASVLDEGAGARDMATVSRELRLIMAELQALAERKPAEADPIDELSKRRATRVSTADVPDRAGRGRK